MLCAQVPSWLRLALLVKFLLGHKNTVSLGLALSKFTVNRESEPGNADSAALLRDFVIFFF